MITLSEFVRMYYAPSFLYGVRSLSTISEYATSIDYYIQFVGNLRLNEINPASNNRFIQGLKGKGLSINTIIKHCRHLNTVFSKAGPPGPRNRDAFGWVKDAPWIRPPQAYRRLPREIPDSQADSLYIATGVCDGCYEYPKYLDDPLLRPIWWKKQLRFTQKRISTWRNKL